MSSTSSLYPSSLWSSPLWCRCACTFHLNPHYSRFCDISTVRPVSRDRLVAIHAFIVHLGKTSHCSVCDDRSSDQGRYLRRQRRVWRARRVSSSLDGSINTDFFKPWQVRRDVLGVADVRRISLIGLSRMDDYRSVYFVTVRDGRRIVTV